MVTYKYSHYCVIHLNYACYKSSTNYKNIINAIKKAAV